MRGTIIAIGVLLLLFTAIGSQIKSFLSFHIHKSLILSNSDKYSILFNIQGTNENEYTILKHVCIVLLGGEMKNKRCGVICG